MQSDKKASEEKTAVSEGFEPPVRCRTPVFEAGSFNHSDNSPFKKGYGCNVAPIPLVWMTGLEPATSWSLTRCATNCATSRFNLLSVGTIGLEPMTSSM